MPELDANYRALIHSPRVSGRTRQILLDRAKADDPAYQPAAMSPAGLDTLRAVLALVLPQPGDAKIDLGARIDTVLASGKGDGWRFASLPPDAEAYRTALTTLDCQAQAMHGCGFVSLEPIQQEELLLRVAEGEAASSKTAGEEGVLDAAQMRCWFEDLRAGAVRVFVAHPATLARMGYSGIAYGGDGEALDGFSKVGANEREAWEPEPQP